VSEFVWKELPQKAKKKAFGASTLLSRIEVPPQIVVPVGKIPKI